MTSFQPDTLHGRIEDGPENTTNPTFRLGYLEKKLIKFRESNKNITQTYSY